MATINKQGILTALIQNVENIDLTTDEYIWYLKLIKAYTKLTLDIRYCSSKDCSCCPESEIKALLQENQQYLDKLGTIGLSDYANSSTIVEQILIYK